MAIHTGYEQAPSVDIQQESFHHAIASSADQRVPCNISRYTYPHPTSLKPSMNWGRLGYLCFISSSLSFEVQESAFWQGGDER
jgi:hypothetical protein